MAVPLSHSDAPARVMLPTHNQQRQNGRWAMLAVAGILATDLTGAGGNWWTPDSSAHLDADGFPTVRVAGEIAIMAAAEAARISAFNKEGPGAKAFDPANMKSNEAILKEVKNGRLAMVAFLVSSNH